MVVLFERLFDSLKQFNEATGVWNPAVRIAIAEFADITDFHPNTIKRTLTPLKDWSCVIVTRKGIGAKNGYGVNLDKIRDYKRMSEKQKAAMPPHLRKPGDDRQDAEEGPIEASVTDRSKHKAAKHVARRKAPVIEMPAPAHEMVTIEVGDAVEVDGFPYANDSADVIQFVVDRDGDGAFAGVSFVGEHKANKTNDPKDVKGEYKENINTPYASSNESLADKSSTPHVEVSEIGITISSDNSSSVAERFETFKTLLQRSLEVDQFKFGLEGAQFLSGERRTEELWTIGLEDEATVSSSEG